MRSTAERQNLRGNALAVAVHLEPDVKWKSHENRRVMLLNLFNLEKDHKHFHDSTCFPCWRFRWMLCSYLIVFWVSFLVGCAPHSVTQPDPSPYEDLLGIYREPLNHLDAVRRGVCPMHPSCSEYSRQAVKKHGFVLGWAMAMDRLLRCGRDELRRAPTILVHGQWKFYDPLVANDNWWYSTGEEIDPDS
jgi:hypothetical protein